MLRLQWDAEPSASRYILERSVNEEDYEILSDSLLLNHYTDTLPADAQTVQYAVAYEVIQVSETNTWEYIESFGYSWAEVEELELTVGVITGEEEKEPEISDYGYSDIIDVEPPLAQPYFESLPSPIHEGDSIDILWGGDARSHSFLLEVRYGTSEAFTTLYEGAQTGYQFDLPAGKTFIELRVMSYVVKEEIISDYAYTSSAVIANRAPTISGEDQDLGTKYKGFEVIFVVSDEDPNERVSVTVQLETDTIFSSPDIDLNVPYTVEITDDIISNLSVGQKYQIIITAVDKAGLTARRVYTFTVVENITTRLTYYVYRDGVPIATTKSLSYVDYMAVGRHEYYIEAMDEDGTTTQSNTVVIEIKVDYATIAAVDSPEDFMELKLREGQPPQTSRNINLNYNEVWLLGNPKPKYEYPNQSSDKISITYSVVRMEDLQKLRDMVASGNLLVYRDRFNERIIGVVNNFPYDIRGMLSHPAMDIWVDTSFTIDEGEYEEEIAFD